VDPVEILGSDKGIFPWLASGITIGFLILCGNHNRRTGYRSTQAEASPVENPIFQQARRPANPEAPLPKPARHS
jgi:hypothetical protein